MPLLAVAAALGLGAGLLRANLRKEAYAVPSLRAGWLALICAAAQYFSFTFRPTRGLIPEAWTPAILSLSMIGLLVFAFLNRRLPGFLWLGGGLLLNATVILLNGGLMPISPEMVMRLVPGWESWWQVGQRLGHGKDLVLPLAQTRLWFLSDCLFLSLPIGTGYRVAFSPGDVGIAIGLLRLLWAPHPDRISAALPVEQAAA